MSQGKSVLATARNMNDVKILPSIAPISKLATTKGHMLFMTHNGNIVAHAKRPILIIIKKRIGSKGCMSATTSTFVMNRIFPRV